MTPTKIEPGQTDVSSGGARKPGTSSPDEKKAERDILPELGLKAPAKEKKSDQANTRPLDRGIDLSD